MVGSEKRPVGLLRGPSRRVRVGTRKPSHIARASKPRQRSYDRKHNEKHRDSDHDADHQLYNRA